MKRIPLFIYLFERVTAVSIRRWNWTEIGMYAGFLDCQCLGAHRGADNLSADDDRSAKVQRTDCTPSVQPVGRVCHRGRGDEVESESLNDWMGQCDDSH